MSLQFSDTTNKSGIVELIDFKCKSNSISYPIEDKTRDINLALDYTLDLIFSAGGKWQFDDSNHIDYPIITTDLISGRRDYTFTEDEQGNLILDIYKVMVKNEEGVYVEIYPIDQQSDRDTSGFWDGRNDTGLPYRYDKTANGIFLDFIPSYSSEDGLKIFINREGSYFTKTDTTKKPGFAGKYHEFLALRPSYQYAYTNGLSNANFIKAEMLEMEEKIKKHYRDRSKDEQMIITSEDVCSI